MWFENLTGFAEMSPAQVRNNLAVDGHIMSSRINGMSWHCGTLETPTLAELRTRVLANGPMSLPIKVREVVGDAKALHADASNASAFFQVASQFNLLEMVRPEITPERGVSIYAHDNTQGPACAIAAGAGTIYRNYFVEVNGQTGQSTGNQIDCLQDIGDALGNNNQRLWEMKNGYVCAEEDGLREISDRLKTMSDHEREELKQKLRIGVHWDTQVTLDGCEHLVTQAYCSALPVGYSSVQLFWWKEFASLVLEAAYEATLYAALLNFDRTGNNKVFLTLIGGGVFANETGWIISAIKRALGMFANSGLDIAIVSYGRLNPAVRELVGGYA